MVDMDNIIEFENLQQRISRLIKVIGVGGAGTNAVNYMYENDPLKQVEYIVCNTDLQALKASPVPQKIQLGKKATGGLGAGNEPEVGQKAAIENLDEIKEVLSRNTKMVFITAGMGGGTGTGAAPQVAKVARELGLLTVGVVTMPFAYEGERKMQQARKGLKELKKYVDSLIVINNERIVEVYGDLGFKEAFHKSDYVLYNAVMSVTKVIVENYEINVDFNDVEAVLKNSGTALIATARAKGPGRAREVVDKVLESPLLNDNRITGAKDLLVLIVSGTDQVTVNEITKIQEYLKKAIQNPKLNVIPGLGEDPSLGDYVSVTLMATGFKEGSINDGTEEVPEQVVFVGEDEAPVIDFPNNEIIDEQDNGAQEEQGEVFVDVDIEDIENSTLFGAGPAMQNNSDAAAEEQQDQGLTKTNKSIDNDVAIEWERYNEVKKAKQKSGAKKAETSHTEQAEQETIVVSNQNEEQMLHQATLFDEVDNHQEQEAEDTTDLSPADSAPTNDNPVNRGNKTMVRETKIPDTKAKPEDSEAQQDNDIKDEVVVISEEDLKNQSAVKKRLEASRKMRSEVEAQRKAVQKNNPVSSRRYAISLSQEELAKLRNYNYRFTRIKDNGSNRAQSGNIVNLEGNNPRWDDGQSFLNPKLD